MHTMLMNAGRFSGNAALFFFYCPIVGSSVAFCMVYPVDLNDFSMAVKSLRLFRRQQRFVFDLFLFRYVFPYE